MNSAAVRASVERGDALSIYGLSLRNRTPPRALLSLNLRELRCEHGHLFFSPNLDYWQGRDCAHSHDPSKRTVRRCQGTLSHVT